MRLRFKQINLEAGRPIAFIDDKVSEAMNLIEGGRIEVVYKRRKLILPINIADKMLKKNEISFSREAVSYLGIRTGSEVEISHAIEPRSTRYVMKKINGLELTKKEIFEIVNDIVNNALNEAEIAYFVSGVYHNGMSTQEAVFLTEAMAKTGRMLKWSKKNVTDKHSVGGIPGNRTTPLVVSICAAAGLVMPKTSSRAITTAAATADVMEAITNISLSVKELQSVVKKTGACLAWGGSLGLAPADDKLIRVEKMLNIDPEAQLIASILSKKLAAGSKSVLLDIPYGRGAKVSLAQAKKLKSDFIRIAKHFKLKVEVVLTKGDQPIGNSIGPVLEVIDLYKIFNREPTRPLDLEKKAIFLASKILEMNGKAKKGHGKKLALKILDSGEALDKFEEILCAQGKKSGPLKLAKFKHYLESTTSGKIKEINNKLINHLGRRLGCPTSKPSGIYLHKHLNERVQKGDVLLTLYSETKAELNDAIRFYEETKPIKIS